MAKQIMDVTHISDPRLKRFFDYWKACRGERTMPARADIDPLDFQYVLGHVALIDVETGDRQRYRFRVDGSTIADLCGLDLTGKYLDEATAPAERTGLERSYGELVTLGQPIHYTGMRNWEKRSCGVEGLLLPLSQDGKAVDMILDCMFVSD